MLVVGLVLQPYGQQILQFYLLRVMCHHLFCQYQIESIWNFKVKERIQSMQACVALILMMVQCGVTMILMIVFLKAEHYAIVMSSAV